MIITGEPHRGIVHVDGRRLDPARSQAVCNHSPDGFSWGYSGSGPAQLALAILMEAGLPDRRAFALHQAFKMLFLADVDPHSPLLITMDVAAWAKEFIDYTDIR